jgi:hypothetical protein
VNGRHGFDWDDDLVEAKRPEASMGRAISPEWARIAGSCALSDASPRGRALYADRASNRGGVSVLGGQGDIEIRQRLTEALVRMTNRAVV